MCLLTLLHFDNELRTKLNHVISGLEGSCVCSELRKELYGEINIKVEGLLRLECM